MKSLKLMIPAVLIPITIGIALSFTSCKKHLFNSIKGKGDTVTETRDLSGFNKISLSIDADLHYVQDSVYFVEISAQQNVLNVLTTDIDAGRLKIEFRRWVLKHSKITIVIHSPDLRAVDLSGSGNFESPSDIVTSDLELNVSGSGDIALAAVHTDELQVKISGSGDISVSGGAVTNQKATISGSGDIEMDGLTASNSDAKISGSGSITVWVVNQLKATISGSGNIRYKGNPVINANISGSGSVIHI
ncbi:head GIN domain-containing protein [Fluviicola sp.]|uniref:head GIN domain-containing protein n=1 Tax=Fluviicola sp. TaxID=1917219 RepID=UPI00262FB98F|nr:head GIN domain-containing protein [Fluviicola sp.]